MIGQLLEWLRWHFTDGERQASEILREENPDQHREYWDCVSYTVFVILCTTPDKALFSTEKY